MLTAQVSELEQFEDYLSEWKFGKIVERKPEEKLGKDQIREIVLRRAYADPEFKAEMMNNARFVWAIILYEALDLKKHKFLAGIQAFHILEETPTQIFLKVPACHRGCAVEGVTERPAEETGSTCHICGAPKPNGAQPCERAQTVGTSRRQLEGNLIEKAAQDQAFRKALWEKPLETYTAHVKELCSGKLPPYLEGVEQLTPVEEADNEMYFVLPTEERFRIER